MKQQGFRRSLPAENELQLLGPSIQPISCAYANSTTSNTGITAHCRQPTLVRSRCNSPTAAWKFLFRHAAGFCYTCYRLCIGTSLDNGCIVCHLQTHMRTHNRWCGALLAVPWRPIKGLDNSTCGPCKHFTCTRHCITAGSKSSSRCNKGGCKPHKAKCRQSQILYR